MKKCIDKDIFKQDVRQGKEIKEDEKDVKKIDVIKKGMN